MQIKGFRTRNPSKCDTDLLLGEFCLQVRTFGCSSFALLFDDIEPELNLRDRRVFSTQAEAQCIVTNKIYQQLQPTDVFLFCPTGERWCWVFRCVCVLMTYMYVT